MKVVQNPFKRRIESNVPVWMYESGLHSLISVYSYLYIAANLFGYL